MTHREFGIEATVEREDGPLLTGAIATSFVGRLKGLIGTRSGETGDEVLVFRDCASIHSFGMRYPIDVAFVDAAGVTAHACRSMRPNRVVGVGPGMRRRGPYTAIERESSAAPWPCVGEHVTVEAKVG